MYCRALVPIPPKSGERNEVIDFRSLYGIDGRAGGQAEDWRTGGGSSSFFNLAMAYFSSGIILLCFHSLNDNDNTTAHSNFIQTKLVVVTVSQSPQANILLPTHVAFLLTYDDYVQ